MAQDVPCLPSPAVALYLLGLSEACLKSTCPHSACGQILRRSTVADLAQCLARHLENHKPCTRGCDTCNTCSVSKTSTSRCNMCRSALSARSVRDSTSGLCFRCVLDGHNLLLRSLRSCYQQELIGEKLQFAIRIRKPSQRERRTPPAERMPIATRSRVHNMDDTPLSKLI